VAYRVRDIQYLLNDRINAHLVPDGMYGPLTKAAVEKFQGIWDLPVTGVVGPETWQRLIIQITYGNIGGAVQALQQNLNVLGYSLAVDGSYGNETRAAVQNYQGRVQIPTDDIVGPVTWSYLVNGRS